MEIVNTKLKLYKLLKRIRDYNYPEGHSPNLCNKLLTIVFDDLGIGRSERREPENYDRANKYLRSNFPLFGDWVEEVGREFYRPLKETYEKAIYLSFKKWVSAWPCSREERLDILNKKIETLGDELLLEVLEAIKNDVWDQGYLCNRLKSWVGENSNRSSSEVPDAELMDSFPSFTDWIVEKGRELNGPDFTFGNAWCIFGPDRQDLLELKIIELKKNLRGTQKQ